MSIRVQDVVRAVADYYGHDPREIIAMRRDQRFTRPRHVAVWIARRLTTYSLPQIGAAIGGRDHTTILYGANKIDRELETDPRLASEIGEIVDALLIAEQALIRLGIDEQTPSPTDYADQVLADPARSAVQISSLGIVTLAVAVRGYRARIEELEQLVEVLRHSPEGISEKETEHA